MRGFGQVIEHLKGCGFNPDTVIDVGVGYGSPDLYKAFSDAKTILIEALPYFEPEVVRIANEIGAEFHMIAVGDAPGDVEISIENSLERVLGTNVLDEPRDGSPIQKIQVTTIDKITKSIPLGSTLLKTDVQGADLRALIGARDTLCACDVVIAEASLINEKNLAIDIINYMDQSGFRLYEVFGALNRPYDDAQAQVDLAFVKRGNPLLSHSGWR